MAGPSLNAPPPHPTPSPSRPAFLITIDTEGDDIWSQPSAVTTRNSAFLPRFQALCERHGLKPTYLTNYEMALCPTFRELARDSITRGTAEVGMHLHAWNSPPAMELDRGGLAYLIEYPEAAMREKIGLLTDLLEEAFGVKMVSHRAGRWAFDERYARLLIERGYRVDCSVTPNVSWRRTLGLRGGNGGSDYTGFPEQAYFLDPSDIGRPGNSPLLEVPMTIDAPAAPFLRRLHKLRQESGRPLKPLLKRMLPPIRWLRPNGRNLESMLGLLDRAAAHGCYAEFMLHSSEFMPGGSPTFPAERDVERLFEHLAILFERAEAKFRGATLAEYRDRFPAWAAAAA